MGTITKTISLSVKNEMDMVIIQIPESSARNILNHHFEKIVKCKEWINSLIFFIPFTLTYFTSDFSDKTIFGCTITADQLSSFYFFCWLAALGYLSYTIWNAIKHKDSVQDIINDLKTNKEC